MAVERVLYTFNPPLIGSPWYYLGIVLVVLGSYYWIVLMLVILRSWLIAFDGLKPVADARGGPVMLTSLHPVSNYTIHRRNEHG